MLLIGKNYLGLASLESCLLGLASSESCGHQFPYTCMGLNCIINAF